MDKRKYKIISLIVMIFLFTYFQTIVYSAFSSTMNLNGTAVAKTPKSVMITDFRLSDAIDATSFYEEFDNNKISTHTRMLSDDYLLLYFVQITNYSEHEVGISEITGLPNNLSYELISYNLGDSLCDSDNKCTSNAVATFLIQITGNIPGDYEFTLEFHFETYHKITYTNLYTYNSYPKKVVNGDDLNITFKDDAEKVSIISNGNVLNYYEQIIEGQTVKVDSVSNDIEIKSSKELSVKVTNFLLHDNLDGESFYEKFGPNVLSTYIRSFSDECIMLYYVDVTNYGENEVGITDITGLPDNLTYELMNYTLGDSLCDDDNKCTSNTTKRILIGILGHIPGDYEFTLEFHFETYHKITYTNIYTDNSYPRKVKNGEDVNITFKENVEKVSIISNGNVLNYYEQILAGQTIKIENSSSNIEVKSANPLTVRITNFKPSSSNPGYVWNEKFSANSASSTIRMLVGDGVSIKIDVEVTVFDESEYKISNIIASNFHKNLSYKIIDYSLGDKICDSTGKCTSNAVKTFQIEITGVAGDYNISFDFEFSKIS